jgi:poly(hydroxyalkanoate) granule-associated protein
MTGGRSMKKAAKKVTALRPMILDNAQQIWLAGLGAFAMAGEEGKDLFHQLIKRGADVQKSGKARVEKLVKTAGKRVTDLRGDAEAAVGRVRFPLDKGMTKAMHRLGIPTRGEILELTKRVEALTKAVERKNGHRRPARKATAPVSAPTV